MTTCFRFTVLGKNNLRTLRSAAKATEIKARNRKEPAAAAENGAMSIKTRRLTSALLSSTLVNRVTFVSTSLPEVRFANGL